MLGSLARSVSWRDCDKACKGVRSYVCAAYSRSGMAYGLQDCSGLRRGTGRLTQFLHIFSSKEIDAVYSSKLKIIKPTGYELLRADKSRDGQDT